MSTMSEADVRLRMARVCVDWSLSVLEYVACREDHTPEPWEGCADALRLLPRGTGLEIILAEVVKELRRSRMEIDMVLGERRRGGER